jgi:hypothetical protein
MRALPSMWTVEWETIARIVLTARDRYGMLLKLARRLNLKRAAHAVRSRAPRGVACGAMIPPLFTDIRRILIMRQVKLLGMALIAVFALSAAAFSAMASAEPAIKNLPEANAGLNWTGENDGTAEQELVALNNTVKCKKAKAEGTEEKTHPLGLFHILFEECTGSGFSCLGLGDTVAGTILALGTWHLVYDKISGELLTATLFLLEHVHFTCGAIVLVLVLGEVLCLDLEPLSEKLSHLFHCHQKEALPLDATWWDDLTGEGPKTAELLCKISGGAYEHCAELALGLVKHAKPLFADD